MKRTISMLLALLLVVICVFPALAVPARAEETTETTEPEAAVVSDETSTSGSGFKLAGLASEPALNYWESFDLYSVLNSGEGFFLFTFSSPGSLWGGLIVSNGMLASTSISSIFPYTSANYPLGSFVSDFSVVDVNLTVCLNYSTAYQLWLETSQTQYFLTEDSRFTFSGTKTYLSYLGYIDDSGLVKYSEASVHLFTGFDFICYSDTASIPGGSPTIPTVTPGGDSLDYGTNYYEQYSPGPTLSVTAESPNGGVLSYAWQRYDLNTKVSEIISGATSNSYTVPTDTVGSYIYSCSVTNTYPTGSSVNGTQWAITIYSETQGAGEGITWQLLDDGTLLISGRGAMSDYSVSANAPWFEYKDSITSIVVGEGITSLGSFAFWNLPNVSYVSLPSTLRVIGKNSFTSMSSLTSLLIPEGVIDIHDTAFSASRLVVLCLPSSLLTFGNKLFNSSRSLVRLYLYSSFPPVSSVNPVNFGSNIPLNSIYVPSGCVDYYKNDENWVNYVDIIYEMEPEVDPIDTIEELSVIVEQILAEMEELNSNKGLWENILDAINNWGQQIVDAIASMPVIGDSITQVQDAIGNLQDDVDQLPNDITTGIGDLMDQHQASAELKGNDSANEILEIIPDQSGDFLASLSTLTAVLNYEGTAAVITMPAIQIPSVGGLFPAFTVLEEQKINLEYYFNQTPEVLIVIVRALFDIAIVGYCIKEFLDLVGAAVNGFGEGFTRQLNGDE